MNLPEHIDPPPRRCKHKLESGKRCPNRRQWSKTVCARHDPLGRLSLTKDQRQAFFDGRAPALEGVGLVAPVQAGYRHVLSPWFYFDVEQVRETSKRKWIEIGDKSGPVEIPWWSIKYTVHDQRASARFIRRSPVEKVDFDQARDLYAPENFEWDHLPGGDAEEAIAQASLESNYTSSHSGAVDDLEPVDAATLNQFSIESQQAFLMRKAESASEREALAMDLRLQAIRAEAKRMGIQLGPEFRQLEHVIGNMEKKISKRAA